MVTQRSAKSLTVVVIADKSETIDGLAAYLGGAGVASRTSRSLRDAASMLSSISAVLLFPDEFEVGEAVAYIASLRSAQPRLLVVIVTSTPQRFRLAEDLDEEAVPPIVLPKPAFGWTILDAIRAQALPAEST